MPRGGRRPGAGRPRSYSEPLVKKTVTLPLSYIERLTDLGAGNLSDGIRILMEHAHTERGDFWYDRLERRPAISRVTGY